MSANVQSINPRKGLAIASLVLGIISIPTFGLFAVGGITGMFLGAVALSNNKTNPQVYGGKNLAIAGLVTSALSLPLIFVFGILGRLQSDLMSGRENAAVHSLLTIRSNQTQYKSLKGHFGTLQELGEADLIEKSYASTADLGPYIYTESEVSTDTYCVHATRTSKSAATRDFVACEDGVIRYIESKAAGMVKRGEGRVLGGDDSAAPTATP